MAIKKENEENSKDLKESHYKNSRKDKVIGMGKQSLTSTFSFAFRKTTFNNEYEKKRTSFLELFFDLSVVFLFTLLAENFASAIGISAQDITSSSHNNYAIPHPVIGIWFWFVNFFLLWLTWYQYGNHMKFFGSENLRVHIMTFIIIISILIQGVSIVLQKNFHNDSYAQEFFKKYGLFISFILARTSFVFGRIRVMFYTFNNEITQTIRKKLIIEIPALVIIFLLFLSIIAFAELEIIDFSGAVTLKNPNHGTTIAAGSTQSNVWIFYATLSSILTATSLPFIISNTFWFKNSRSSKHEHQILFHNKERHHLFIIIALGEMLLVNAYLGGKHWYPELIPSMMLNLLFSMVIWYLYKWIFFKTEPASIKKNHYLFLISNLLFTIGIILMLAALSSLGEIYINDDPTRTNYLVDINKVKYTHYPAIFLTGFLITIISIFVYVTFSRFEESIYTSVLRRVYKRLVVILVSLFILAIGMLIAISFKNVNMNELVILGSITGALLIAAILFVVSVDNEFTKEFNSKEDIENYINNLEQ